MSTLVDALRARFGERVQEHVALAPFTTFKVGGPADVLLETRGSDEILEAIRIAHASGMPITMLGGGSNVLIGDRGIRGLVIRTRGGEAVAMHDGLVRADAALAINALVRWTITHGWQGIEAWAGTPGTVGGAIHGNAHWKGTDIGSIVASVRLARRDGTILQVSAERMEFDYDRSRIKSTGEVVLWAAFRLAPHHDPAALRAVARASLAYRKQTQPLESPSAGCIFMNPDPARDSVPDGMPASAGALVDRAGMKGASLGGARVSPTHANFIVNDGRATAADIRALVEACRARVREQFGVALADEIVCLGEF
jgi:UDP-N-acetylmuramate dehydrogenase